MKVRCIKSSNEVPQSRVNFYRIENLNDRWAVGFTQEGNEEPVIYFLDKKYPFEESNGITFQNTGGAYYVSTLMNHQGGLQLWGDIPAWNINSELMDMVRPLCKDEYDVWKANKTGVTSSRKPVKSAKHILKSGYYNTDEHPEGGGTCDYCSTEIAPGDGYEKDFQSTQDTAAHYLFIALGGDENRAYMVTENRDNLVRWLQGADEDIDEDWVEDVIREIINAAFDDKDGYMCSTCLEQRMKKAAEDWVSENW